MQGNITIKDIAARLRVSHTTVSRALRNDPTISEETTRKVRELAESLGYVRHPAGAVLSTGKTMSILFVVPYELGRFPHLFHMEILQGLVDEVTPGGFSVNLIFERYLRQRGETVFSVLSPARADGAVILLTKSDESQFAGRAFSLPVVMVNHMIEGVQADFVVADDRQAVYRATKHLIDLGHRSMAYLAGPPGYYATVQRLAGYRECLVDHGITFDDELVASGQMDKEGGYDAMTQLLGRGIPFSAVFCHRDAMALGAISALAERDLKVPEDVAVVGFDDDVFAELVTPSLTTVRKPRGLMGSMAGRILLQRIEGALPDEPVVFPLRSQLVLRQSSGSSRS